MSTFAHGFNFVKNKKGMKNMKNIIKVLLFSFLSVILAACGNSSTTEEDGDGAEQASGDTLYIGMEAAYPPYNWTQSDDSNGGLPIQNSSEFANGYDVHIAQKISEATGQPVEIVKTSWDGLVPALQSDKIDLIIAGMTPTNERREAIDFTDSYYDVQFTMVMKEGSPYEDSTGISDFDGARVSGQQGTLHYDILSQLEGADVQQALKDFSSLRVALESDKIDAYVSEYPEAVSATNAIDGLTFIELEDSFTMPEGTEDYLAIGVKPGNEELLNKVNNVLAGISEEERQELMDEAIANQPSEQE